MDTIEDLQLEHGLSYTNNKLHVIVNNERLQQYDFRTRKWTKSPGKTEQSLANDVSKKNNE
jgi:hypothetical protein